MAEIRPAFGYAAHDIRSRFSVLLLIILNGVCRSSFACAYIMAQHEFPWMFCWAGGIVFNLWQWVVLMHVKDVTNDIQWNLVFFVCVWLLPMVLLLSLDIYYDSFDSEIHSNKNCLALSTA